MRPPRALLERVDPRVKLACVALWAVCVVSTPPRCWRLLAAYALVVLALLLTNQRLVPDFLRRTGSALLLIVPLGVVLAILGEGGPVLWRAGLLEVTRGGLEKGVRVAGVATLCVAAVALVWASTERADLLAGLRGLGAPEVFVGVLAFMLRYLDVLRPELHRLTDARAARTVGPAGRGRLRSGAHLVGTLFLRAHDRADRVADAMAARGYAGRLRTLRPVRTGAGGALAGAVFAVVIVALRCGLGVA